jgi:hypothetical protein
VKTIEPPCTERYARWCGRSAAQLMSSLLPDFDADNISADAITAATADISAALRDFGEFPVDLDNILLRQARLVLIQEIPEGLAPHLDRQSPEV